MDLREHFIGFYEAISAEQRIGPVHISLYMAILNQYIMQGTEAAIQVTRQALMEQAKINARSTYNKTMRDLHDFGFIKYIPSYSFYLGSLVYIKKV